MSMISSLNKISLITIEAFPIRLPAPISRIINVLYSPFPKIFAFTKGCWLFNLLSITKKLRLMNNQRRGISWNSSMRDSRRCLIISGTIIISWRRISSNFQYGSRNPRTTCKNFWIKTPKSKRIKTTKPCFGFSRNSYSIPYRIPLWFGFRLLSNTYFKCLRTILWLSILENTTFAKSSASWKIS